MKVSALFKILAANGARLLIALAFLAGAASPALCTEFQPYGRGDFAKLKKAHAGRPLIAHFWSVTCAPCLAELADWAKVARDNAAIDFVFVNTDRDADRPRAQARLEKAGLTEAQNYAFADPFAEKLYYEVEPTWRGELPFNALVNRKGRAIAVIGEKDRMVEDWIKSAQGGR